MDVNPCASFSQGSENFRWITFNFGLVKLDRQHRDDRATVHQDRLKLRESRWGRFGGGDALSLHPPGRRAASSPVNQYMIGIRDMRSGG